MTCPRTRPVLAATLALTLLVTEAISQRQPCPVACANTTSPSQWTVYNSVGRVAYCEEPVLFQVSLSEPLETLDHITHVKACTAGDPSTISRASDYSSDNPSVNNGRFAKRQDTNENCPEYEERELSAQLATWGNRDAGSGAADSALRLLDEMKTWVNLPESLSCTSPTILFGHLNGTFAGHFGGHRINTSGDSAGFFDKTSTFVQGNGIPERLVLQHCGSSSERNSTSGITSGTTAGVAVASNNGFASVHDALRRWRAAECVADDGSNISQVPGLSASIYPSSSPTGSSMRLANNECRIERVEQGDICPTLAERCGITPAEYTRYNNGANHCSTLRVGQPVCCSAGDLPDVKPKPKPNGQCNDYVTQPDDDCSALEARHGLERNDLHSFNNGTWGWSGCSPLPLGIRICLSRGDPPLPAEMEGAECGPSKPGSDPPSDKVKLEDLNPCPLNVCCNVWGKCGLNEDFCTVERSETGAPGTSGHKKGCVQNCGKTIVNNGRAPDEFRKLGYFEAWNFDRPCLHMDASQLSNHHQEYTDIHFAFAEITEDFHPVIPSNQRDQWQTFLRTEKTFRKILAYGGWAFSTEPETYHIFREAVKPPNRRIFARRCVDHAIDAGLDGLDFDWEYPGAPDIPGIPPGRDDEGENYLEFLKIVREMLPSRMTLSIAAPASYWYLKQFPINEMAPYLDYIVYMTYDLHGQWDHDNPWSNPGCPEGNCLRSHVNVTETNQALVMITKAGVPAHKILVGVATYGRSFKMAEAGCTTSECHFLGDINSPARAGECTETSGYLALAEIQQIISENPTAETWMDLRSGSNIMVYNDTEWVAYMDERVRDLREFTATRNNFGGTIEWAVDLQEFLELEGDPLDEELFEGPGNCGIMTPDDTLEELAASLDSDSRQEALHCYPIFLIDVLMRMSVRILHRFDEIMEGNTYDDAFERYERLVRQTTGPMVRDHVRGAEGDLDLDDYFDCTTQRGLQWISSDSCPTNETIHGNFTFSFKSSSAEDKFYADLEEATGVPKSNMSLTNDRYTRSAYTYSADGSPFYLGPCDIWTDRAYCASQYWYDIPLLTPGHNVIAVHNPKEVISESLDRFETYPAQLAGMVVLLNIGYMHHQYDWTEIVDTVMTPILLADEALDGMEKVLEIGEEMAEQEKKNAIFLGLTVALFFIPFAGKALGSALGVAAVARIAALIGDLGLVAIDMYKIFGEDENPVMLGLGIALTLTGGLSNWTQLGKASTYRRAATQDELLIMGTRPVERFARVDSIALSVRKNTCPRWA